MMYAYFPIAGFPKVQWVGASLKTIDQNVSYFV